MFLLFLTFLALLFGVAGGWILRARRSIVELARQRLLHADCQSELDMSRRALEVNEQALETLRVEQELESRLQATNPNDTHGFTTKKLRDKTPYLKKVANEQKVIIEQNKLEQIKLNKSIIVLHKKYQESNNATLQLRRKIGNALEAPSFDASGKISKPKFSDKNETRSADELASAVRKLHTQAHHSQQLKNDYETINSKYVASSARVTKLESSLTRAARQEQELQEINIELNEQSRQRRTLEKNLEEVTNNHSNVVVQLESKQLEREQHLKKIDELNNIVALGRVDKKRITALEANLNNVEDSKKSVEQKVESLQNDIRVERAQHLKKVDELNTIVALGRVDKKRITALEANLNNVENNKKSVEEKVESLQNDVREHAQQKEVLVNEKHEQDKHRAEQDDEIVSLGEKLGASISEINALKKENQGLESVAGQLDNTAKKNKALLNKQEVAEGKLDILRNQARSAEEKNRQLNKQITGLKKDSKEIAGLQTAAAAESDKKMKAATSEISALQGELTSLRKDNKEIAVLQTAAAESDKKLKAADDEINGLLGKLESLRKDNKEIAVLQTAAAESDKKLKAANSENSGLLGELTSLRKDNKEIAVLQTATGESDKKLKAADDEINGLLGQLTSLRKDNKEIAVLQTAVAESDEIIKAADIEISGLQGELASLRKDSKKLAGLETAAAESTSKLESADNEVSRLQAKLEGLQKNQKQVTELESVVAESERKFKAASTQNSGLQLELESLRKDNKKIAGLETAAAESERKFKAASSQNSGLQLELESLRKDNKQIATLQTAANESAKKLDSANNEFKNLQVELVSLQNDNKKMAGSRRAASESESELKAANRKIDTFQAELESLRKGNKTIPALQATALESEKSLKAAVLEISSLQVELARLQKDNTAIPVFQAAATESSNNLKAANAEINTLNVKLASVLKDNNAIPILQATVSESTKKLKIANTEINALNEKLANIQKDSKTILELQVAATQSETKFNAATNEISSLNVELTNLQKNNRSVSALQAEVDESTEKLNAAIIEIGSLSKSLEKKACLDKTLQARECTIADLLKQQAHSKNQIQVVQVELDKSKSSLSKCSATLSERSAESQRLTAQLEDQRVLQKQLVQSNIANKKMHEKLSASDAVATKLAKLEQKLKAANDENMNQQAELKSKASLEITLEKKQADIKDLQNKLANYDENRRELHIAKASLAKSSEALWDTVTESDQLSAKLEEQQELQDTIKEQENTISDMHKRVVNFEALKYELARSRDSHEQLRDTIPDIDALHEKIKKIERMNIDMQKEYDSIPKLEKQLEKVRLNHKELKAIHKKMTLQLEAVKKENTSYKRKATILSRQANQPSAKTVHLKREHVGATITLPNANTSAKTSIRKKKASKKKRVAKKTISVKSSNSAVIKKTGRKTQRKALADDLQKIHGIGPVLEKLLNKNGITRFDQLAKLDKKGVEALSAKLGSFSNRIKRDEWVKSAAKLAKKKSR